ncbi:hypothetical protein [Paenibacillus turicensis]|nr:hypothetical protein [Paenibacillus turicensis]
MAEYHLTLYRHSQRRAGGLRRNEMCAFKDGLYSLIYSIQGIRL